MLKQLVSSIFGILFFKKGPQDVPYSPMALGVLLAVTGTLIFLIAGKAQFGLMLFNIFYIFVAFFAILAAAKKKQRYVQTMLAYLSCAWVITVLCMLVMSILLLIASGLGFIPAITTEKLNLMMTMGLSKADLPVAFTTIFLVIVMALLIWRFLVDAHILRNAIDITFQRAVFLIFFINLIPLIVHALVRH